MSPVQVACPGCGAPIEFRLGSSMVTVCEHCHSVVARGDRGIDDLGKIAFLAEIDSPLAVGLTGRYQGHGFEVLGVARLGHEAGGYWDEWYLAFDDGRWGWLAEAQGRRYLTFAVPAKGREDLPAYEALRLGQRIRLRSKDPPLVVAEKGVGRPMAARGEIPYRLDPGETYRYADLSGRGRRFGTLDYSGSPPSLYLGQEVALDDLQLSIREGPLEHEPRTVEAVQIACPQCGGSLDLKAPDKAERVGCPFCGSLLDASHGKLRLLHAAEGGPVKLPLPIGAQGRLRGNDYTVIGYLRRATQSEGAWYYWDEYLLYNERIGFRWLVSSDQHWSFVEPLPPGGVEVRGRTAYHADQPFRWFQQGIAEVRAVIGEFYWKVAVGEQVSFSDYIRPPQSLSREIASSESGSGEISWSLGTYLPVDEVERAFGLKSPLRRPSTIGASQPFPFPGLYRYWAYFAAVLFLVGVYFQATGRRKVVFEGDYGGAKAATSDASQTFFGGPLTIEGGRNIEVQASAAAANFWLWIDGDLVDEDSGLVQGFSIPVEFYQGVDGGESWSEGSRESAAYLSALPAGKYSLHLEVHAEPSNPPLSLHVRVRQDVPRLLHWLLAMLAISVIPAAVAAYHVSFESRRWSDSNVK